MYSQIPNYLKAMGLTLQISMLSIIISIGIGIVCALIGHFRIFILHRLAQMYIALSRNTPLLIQLFFLYYGLPKVGVVISEFGCAVIGLSFLGGSYMSEAFRAGIESVGSHQVESAKSLGMNPIQIIVLIILPQALSVAIPLIGANAIFLIKESSIVCVIAVAEVMYLTKDLIGMTYMTYEALALLVIAYLVMLLPLSSLTNLLERRLRHAEHGS